MTYVQTPSNAQLSLAATFLAAVGAQLRALDPAFSEDNALFLDTLEGETGDIFDMIDLAFAAVDDLETSAAGVPPGGRFWRSGKHG